MNSPNPTPPDLGPCACDWCDRPAVVYVAGPTVGESPRVTIIGGRRADELAVGERELQLRCLDCAMHAVEDVASGVTRACSPVASPQPVEETPRADG